MTDVQDPDNGGIVGPRKRARESVTEAAQNMGSRAEELQGTARSRAVDEVDTRSTEAGRQAESVGQTVRRAGQEMRDQGNDLGVQMADWAAGKFEQVGLYLRESDGESILRDAEDLGRRQPWAVAAVSAAAGLAAARFLKASSSRTRTRPSSAPATFPEESTPGWPSAGDTQPWRT